MWSRTLVLVVSLCCPLFPTGVEGFSWPLLRADVISVSRSMYSRLELLASERTQPSRVGTIMAMLATFDEAGVLPLEGTPRANQLIHALIQLQSAFLKSPSRELSAYLLAAEKQWELQHSDREFRSLTQAGLTSRVLESLILYDKAHPLWEKQEIVTAVKRFNLTQSDWVLMVALVNQAEMVFHERGDSIHQFYDQWRVKMPGGQR